jgi:hypothetical protein
VKAAALPGILKHDKQAAWDKGVRDAQATVAACAKAAQGPDGPRAAGGRREAAHELRTARAHHPATAARGRCLPPDPVVVYHYQLESFSMLKIAASAKEMATKMTVNAAVLPERMKARGPRVRAARTALSAAVAALQTGVAAGDEEGAAHRRRAHEVRNARSGFQVGAKWRSMPAPVPVARLDMASRHAAMIGAP